MIYLDACALIKFISQEKETAALRSWRGLLPHGTELLTSELSQLEGTRTLLRAGIDHQRVPYLAGQALRGVFLVELTWLFEVNRDAVTAWLLRVMRACR